MNTAAISRGDKVKFYTDLWSDGRWIVGNVVNVRWTSQGQYAEVEGRSGREYQMPVGKLEKIR